MLSEELTGDQDRFSIPISSIPDDVVYEVARRRGLDGYSLPQGTEIQYWELEPTLENLDDRRDHRRALDASIGKAVELMDSRSYDLIVTEVDYDIMDLKEEDRRTDRWYQGEIDLMLVDTDKDVVRAVEVKPHRGLPRDHNGEPVLTAPKASEKVREQHEHQSFAFDRLNEELEGFEMHYIPEKPVYESELLPSDEIPDLWEGRYRGRENAMEAMSESDSFQKFMEEFVLPENPDILSEENRLTRKETGLGDFVTGYLERNRL